MDALAEEVRLREEREREKNKFKRLKRLSRDSRATSHENKDQQMDLLAESEFMNTSDMKFVPIQEPPKEPFPSPIGKMHTIGAQVKPEVLKGTLRKNDNINYKLIIKSFYLFLLLRKL